ncbi:MAG: twin-arginine translocase TatA/TatE family subunit [Bacteroidales bacterium]|nr:twin-arginine translocase TatA/TatE family subunit [Bacteroidales bacterium]
MEIIPAHIILFGISGGEILIILVAVLLLFGPKKIPEIARMLGRGINEVKKVQREINSEIHRYSADIEHEARDVQEKIDRLKKDITTPIEEPADKKEKPAEPINDPQNTEKTDQESDPISDTKDAGDDLPYPYNQKTGDGL